MIEMRRKIIATAGAALASAGLWAGGPALAQVYQQEIRNDIAACAPGKGPAALVTITNIKSSSGKLRVQSYRSTKADWLASGRWVRRIELPARAGTMKVCMPLPEAGQYGIAVRHDVNGNGSTDLTKDGGGMSNNPSINLLNLGRPSYTKTRFRVGEEPTPLTIAMRYM